MVSDLKFESKLYKKKILIFHILWKKQLPILQYQPMHKLEQKW